MRHKIESRYEAEVYLTKFGLVAIKQDRPDEEDSVILLHPDEVPELIKHLESTRQEALDFVPDPQDLADSEE